MRRLWDKFSRKKFLDMSKTLAPVCESVRQFANDGTTMAINLGLICDARSQFGANRRSPVRYYPYQLQSVQFSGGYKYTGVGKIGDNNRPIATLAIAIGLLLRQHLAHG